MSEEEGDSGSAGMDFALSDDESISEAAALEGVTPAVRRNFKPLNSLPRMCLCSRYFLVVAIDVYNA